MSGGRERELKYSIESREDFLRLRDDPAWGERAEPERQVNHYFDAPDGRLRRSRVLLRVREEAGAGAPRRVLTVKLGAELRPGCFDSVELEQEVSAETLASVLERPPALLDLPGAAMDEVRRLFGRPPLVRVGVLENERVRRGGPGRPFEIDRIAFPDGSEAYELEVETEDLPGAEAWVRERVLGAGISLSPQRWTKMERLLKLLEP